MGLSDPVRVVVGVAPSPEIPAQAAAVAKQIEASLSRNLNALLGAQRTLAGAFASPMAGLSEQFTAFLAPMLGIGAAVAGVNALKDALTRVVEMGVSFNSVVEESTIGIAGMMAQMDPKKFATLGVAMEGAREVMTGIRKEALTTVATVKDLAESTQGLIGPMLRAGIPLERFAETSAMLSRAVSAVMPWARSGQFIQEGRAILTGDINQNAFLARALDIRREEVFAAQRAGKMYEFLNSRLSRLNEAAETMATTLTGRLSNLRDMADAVFGKATENIFTNLTGYVRQITTYIGTEQFQKGLDSIMRVVQMWMTAGFDTAVSGANAVSGAMAFSQGDTEGMMAAGRAEGQRQISEFFLGIGRSAISQMVTGLVKSVENIEKKVTTGTVNVQNPGL